MLPVPENFKVKHLPIVAQKYWHQNYNYTAFVLPLTEENRDFNNENTALVKSRKCFCISTGKYCKSVIVISARFSIDPYETVANGGRSPPLLKLLCVKLLFKF